MGSEVDACEGLDDLCVCRRGSRVVFAFVRYLVKQHREHRLNVRGYTFVMCYELFVRLGVPLL